MKKFVASLLSVLMLATLLTAGAFAATPNLSVSIDGELEAFGAGNVTLPIVVKNNDQTNSIQLTQIEITGGGFDKTTLTLDSPLTLTKYTSSTDPATQTTTHIGTIQLPAVFRGSSQQLGLKLTDSSGGAYTTNLIVAKAAVREPSGGGTAVKEDAQVFVASYENAVLQSGGANKFPLTLDTRTGGWAMDVYLYVSGPEGYADKFAWQQDTVGYYVDNLAGQKKVSPELWIASDVPDGRYALTLKLNYTDLNGNAFERTETILVTVFGKSKNTPYVRSAKFAVAEIDKENKATLNVNIFNPMTASIWDVNVSMNVKGSEGFSPLDSARPVAVPSISAGKTGAVPLTLYVNKETGNYPITFDISYKDAGGAVRTLSETVYVEVVRAAGAGTDKGSRPRIIIQSYKIDVDTVEAGKEFTLEFSLQNTSTADVVSNIKVVLGSAPAPSGSGGTAGSTDVFFPSAGSNSFFIEKIPSKGVSTHTIKLMTSQSVEPGVYPVKLDINYEDGAANQLQSEEQISFPVTQEQRLELQNFNVPTDGSLGNPIVVSGQYINMGKSTIYNFSIGVDGDFSMMEGYGGYVGNLSSGYNAYLDDNVIIVPNAEGECKGAIVFKYEDSQGNAKEMRRDITVNVMSMDPGGMGGMGGGDIGGMLPGGMSIDPETGNYIDANGQMYDPNTMEPISSGMALWLVILLCVLGAAVVAGGAVTIIVLKKRKAKKDLVEDEED